MSITQELARYGNAVEFRKLPLEVVDRVKYLFLDFIGVAIQGVKSESSKRLYRFVREMGKGNGVIIGTKDKAPPIYSALANGTSSHAIEMDDVNNESSLHPGVFVFSSALATGEMVGATGKRFIEAVVTGYEVMVRLGKAIGPANSYSRGFHPTATCGTLGKWECKYQVIWIPKSRRKAVYGGLRKYLGPMLRELARQRECIVEEGHLQLDHVHMLLSIPPTYAVSQVRGFIKGKSAIHIARNYLGRRQNCTGQHCWARGYDVSTVGRDEATIREYITKQEAADQRLDQLNMFDR